MSGEELIAWAVAKCEKEGLPPHDANILMFIRGEHNLPTKQGEVRKNDDPPTRRGEEVA